jgi:hypothetical protein
MDGILAAVKLSLRITTEAFDSELTDLINAALLDLGIAGVNKIAVSDTTDALIRRAVTTYVRLYFGLHFGEPGDYDRLKASYDEQKAQLSMATGYTTWGTEENG